MPASTTTAATASLATERPRPAIDRVQAARQFAEAQRLYDTAMLVHERRVAHSVDSAPLAHRALTVLFRLLVRLHGETPPDDFAALVERARAILAAESLTADNLGDDVAAVAEMRQRFLEPEAELTPADERRYDRAFVRVGELFSAVHAYLDERLPSESQSLRRHWKTALALSVALVVGLVVGMRLRPTPAQSSSSAAPVAPAGPTGPGFAATFYRDTEHREVAFTRIDRSIAFDWASEGPPGLDRADGFSARWDGRLQIAAPGLYTFHLTSDDGSRLLIDGKAAIDNWGSHVAVTREIEIKLENGLHQIRVEYFEDVGTALVRLEWSSPSFERKLLTADDLR